MLGYFGGYWDTWDNRHKVRFDGINRLIYVNPDTTSLNVEEDIYSSWKEWLLYEDTSNIHYLPAFYTFGGDPTTDGQTAPKYFFLLNGWRVVVDAISVSIATNLYADGGESPFIKLNGGNVENKTSDVPVVNFNGEMVLDEDSVHSALDSYGSKDDWKSAATLTQEEHDHLLGLDTSSLSQLANITTKVDETHESILGSWEITGNQLIMYRSDASVLRTFDLADQDDTPSETRVFKRTIAL